MKKSKNANKKIWKDQCSSLEENRTSRIIYRAFNIPSTDRCHSKPFFSQNDHREIRDDPT